MKYFLVLFLFCGSAYADVLRSNSTTVPLADGQEWAGTWQRVSVYDSVIIAVKTDVDGVLYADFSPDGINVDSTLTYDYDASTIEVPHRLTVTREYFRARFKNDSGGAQSYFRLQSSAGDKTPLAAPLRNIISEDADAAIVRAVDAVQIDVPFGRFAGYIHRAKFGYNADIDTLTDPEDVWAYGGVRTSPTSTFTPYVASDSTSDTDVDVTIQCLVDGQRVNTTVNLNGQTGVSVGITASECTRLWNSDSAASVGNISLTSANNFSSGVPSNQNEVLAYATIESQQSQVAADRVPDGHSSKVEYIHVSLSRGSGAAGSARIHFQTRETGGTWRTRIPMNPTTSVPYSRPVFGLVLPAGTDWRLRVIEVSDSDSIVDATVATLESLD